MLSVVPEDPAGRDDHTSGGGEAPASVIDQIVRDGARRMLAEALQAEVDAYTHHTHWVMTGGRASRSVQRTTDSRVIGRR